MLTILLGASAVGCSGGGSKIDIRNAVMPVPGSSDQTSVYLTITNSGDEDDVLLNADTDIASMTHLHQTEIDDDGRASMSTTRVVKVEANESVVFAPGGRHLMLMHPEDLKPGSTFTLWLDFRRAGTVKTTVQVIDFSDLAP